VSRGNKVQAQLQTRFLIKHEHGTRTGGFAQPGLRSIRDEFTGPSVAQHNGHDCSVALQIYTPHLAGGQAAAL